MPENSNQTDNTKPQTDCGCGCGGGCAEKKAKRKAIVTEVIRFAVLGIVAYVLYRAWKSGLLQKWYVAIKSKFVKSAVAPPSVS